MRFAEPWLLLALVAVPAAVVAYRLVEGATARNAIRHPGVPTLVAVLPASPRWRRHLPAALAALALAVLVAAIARPHVAVSVPRERAAVMLVTDVSRSMRAEDVEPNRLEAARRAGLSFVERLPDRLRLGAVTFAEAPQVVNSPSTDHDRTRAVLNSLYADGGTATGDALMAALDAFDETDRDRARRGSKPAQAIVLLSDGASTSGLDPLEAAREARRRAVPIYTVALGTEGAVIGVAGRAVAVSPDPEALEEIARASGGEAFEARDADELDSVYESLGSHIGTRREWREATAAFAGAGALLLLVATGLSLRWTGRLP